MIEHRAFTATSLPIEGLMRMTAKFVPDERGTTTEIFRQTSLASAAAPFVPAQVNVVSSRQGVIRGLHAEAMAKLVSVVDGRAFGAYLDARRESPTFGTIVTTVLAPGEQVFVPQGVCNGSQTLTAWCSYVYLFDREWSADMPNGSVHPMDPALAIDWPLPVDHDADLLSDRDRSLPRFSGDISARHHVDHDR